MKTPDEFFGEWTGKGIDFDGYYGFQCMDLAQQFCKECIGHQLPAENAINVWNNYPTDIFDRIENTPTGIPVKGDIMLWTNGVGQYGHIAVFKDGDANSFNSFDQNWPINSLCHFQPHSYKYVQGWLRKKAPPAPPAPEPQPVPEPTPPPTPPVPSPEPIPAPPVPEPTPTPTPAPVPSFWTKLLAFIKNLIDW
jgi:hypothetical protein